jgi:hypothetical protein
MLRLALAMGVKHPQLESMLRDLLLDEARRAWSAQGVVPNVSQLSVTTGLNRKAVASRVREVADPLPHTDMSASAKTLTLWLQMLTDDPVYRSLPLVSEGTEVSFESLARLASRGNVHHRAILDELVRLNMVSELGGRVELGASGFVPVADLSGMLAFLGDNARDHLLAGVSNVLGEEPRMLERAVFANGLSIEDCERLHQRVRERWDALHHELAHEMRRAVDAAGPAGSARIRVGIYTYYEDGAAGEAPGRPGADL